MPELEAMLERAHPTPDVWYLAGPTASGKSAVAMSLARQLNGEIISIDSMQVYKGLDVGTAKPSATDRSEIPHHLVDVVDLNEPFDAARFCQLAEGAVSSIRERGRSIIFCGGTGLYFKAWMEGVGKMPPADPELRAQLNASPLEALLKFTRFVPCFLPGLVAYKLWRRSRVLPGFLWPAFLILCCAAFVVFSGSQPIQAGWFICFSIGLGACLFRETHEGFFARAARGIAQYSFGIYKHVPMMENNVYDAVKNNVFALLNLLEVAEQNGCPSFVLISSDKAVNPANVMGATKRLGELIISCRRSGLMRCVAVRFGNVLGSNGSVVPVFLKQIRENQQLTITHPDITRFFMTTREAVSLVLQGFAIGRDGDTLVLDMGEPVRIIDLAKTLIRLSGKSEDEVGIRFTGLREREKLIEELSYATEEIHPTSFPKISQIRGTPHREDDLKRHLSQLRTAMSANDAAAIRVQLKEIIPEYCNRAELPPKYSGVLSGQNMLIAPQCSSFPRNSGNATRYPAARA